MRKEHQALAIEQVVERTRNAYLNRGADPGKSGEASEPDATLEDVLMDTLFWEKERLKKERPTRAVIRERMFWSGLSRQFQRTRKKQYPHLLEKMIRYYAEEISGGFNPRIHRSITKIAPLGWTALWDKLSPMAHIRQNSGEVLKNLLEISGPLDALAALKEKGTLIFAPTHFSNFDSIALGYALHHSGLPPAIYGAGLNLFTNPALGFLMNHLGAYKVDRKKKGMLYKQTLKSYASISLEFKYNNLFFPGGTRSRSGALESKLKLGLLGCGLTAYLNNLQNKRERPSLFVVPCTVNYGLVLEAETLIDDFLQETGKSRYIILKDESSQRLVLLKFLRKLLSLQSKIHIRFGPPMDLFGNRVRPDGQSVDKHGRPIRIREYLVTGSSIAPSPQRDQQYTAFLGRKILQAFQNLNVLMPTNLISKSVYDCLARKYAHMDRYRLFNLVPLEVSTREVLEHLNSGLENLKEAHQREACFLDATAQGKTAEEIMTLGMNQLQSYHGKKCLREKGSTLRTHQLKTLFYYRNKVPGDLWEGAPLHG